MVVYFDFMKIKSVGVKASRNKILTSNNFCTANKKSKNGPAGIDFKHQISLLRILSKF